MSDNSSSKAAGAPAPGGSGMSRKKQDPTPSSAEPSVASESAWGEESIKVRRSSSMPSTGGTTSLGSGGAATATAKKGGFRKVKTVRGGPSVTTIPIADPTLQDRLAATALAGTVGVLRFATDATGRLVQPSVQVAQSVVLPALWAAIVDMARSYSPERLQDWFRIFASLIRHFVGVLVETERGRIWLSSIGTILFDILRILSTSASRQFLMDMTGCGVRLAEACHTPEVKIWIQQMAVAGCRLVDATSGGTGTGAISGQVKLMIHDIAECAWKFLELCSDPASTTAAAEITAYLCYALEMEQVKLADSLRSSQADAERRQAEADEEHKKDPYDMPAAQASLRRRQRDAYQNGTYPDGYSTLLTDPECSVEQVLLQTLGVPEDDDEDDEEEEQESDAVPVKISVDGVKEEDGESKKTGAGEGGSFRGFLNDNFDDTAEARGINIRFLEEKIYERSQILEESRMSRKPAQGKARIYIKKKDADKTDLEDLDAVVVTVVDEETDARAGEASQEAAKTSTASKKRVRLQTSGEDEDATNAEDEDEQTPVPREAREGGISAFDHSTPMEGETSIDQFYRVLDSVLEEKRSEAVDAAMHGDFLYTRITSTHGNVRVPRGKPQEDTDDPNFPKPPKNLSELEDMRKYAANSIRERLDAIRAELNIKLNPTEREQLRNVENFVYDRRKYILYAVLAMLAVSVPIGSAVMGFAAYGVYVYMYPPKAVDGSPTASPVSSMFNFNPFQSSGPAANEIVIRIVREGASVDGATVLANTGRPAMEEMAQCVTTILEGETSLN